MRGPGTSKRCTKCIMPETMSGITFDEQGICSFCSNYIAPHCQGAGKLRTLVDSLRIKNKKYDCIVPVSGGRDSTYVLWYAKRVLDLDILAVNGDNEFRHKQADINLRSACEALDVDMISIRSKKDYGHKIVKNRIRAGIRLGQKGMGARALLATNFCHACSVIVRSAIYSEAEKYQVPLILRGDSLPEKVGYRVASELRLANKIKDRLGRALTLTFIKDRYYGIRLRSEYPVPGNSRFARRKPILKNPGIRELSLFDYVEWDRSKIKQTIREELGWEKPKDNISSWRFDCRLHDLVDYCFFNSFGCTHNCVGYSNMINAGQMTRREALEQEEARIDEIWHHLEFLLQEIGLSTTEILAFHSLTNLG